MSDSRVKVLRGEIDSLEGSQDRHLISWARFHMGYQTVLLHGLFVHVPELAEGDEVEVAGIWARDGFEGLFCRKVGEDRAHESRMKEERGRRELFWATFLVVIGLILVGSFLYWAPSFLWICWSLAIAFSWVASLWGRLALSREAEKAVMFIDDEEVLFG